MNMFKFIEMIRGLLGPLELRAFRRGLLWGLVAFAADFTFCMVCAGDWVMGVGYGAIFGWFGFVAGLVTGLMDGRRVT